MTHLWHIRTETETHGHEGKGAGEGGGKGTGLVGGGDHYASDDDADHRQEELLAH